MIKNKQNVVETAMGLMEEDMDTIEGVCIKCGEITHGVEPDAEKYKCESCETDTVYGAQQIVLLFG
jgi:hypothetical protein|tara:strand:- start:149 stop:346 length:198 start_codon:yes stop_codon:yes gene_type:complete